MNLVKSTVFLVVLCLVVWSVQCNEESKSDTFKRSIKDSNISEKDGDKTVTKRGIYSHGYYGTHPLTQSYSHVHAYSLPSTYAQYYGYRKPFLASAPSVLKYPTAVISKPTAFLNPTLPLHTAVHAHAHPTPFHYAPKYSIHPGGASVFSNSVNYPRYPYISGAAPVAKPIVSVAAPVTSTFFLPAQKPIFPIAATPVPATFGYPHRPIAIAPTPVVSTFAPSRPIYPVASPTPVAATFGVGVIPQRPVAFDFGPTIVAPQKPVIFDVSSPGYPLYFQKPVVASPSPTPIIPITSQFGLSSIPLPTVGTTPSLIPSAIPSAGGSWKPVAGNAPTPPTIGTFPRPNSSLLPPLTITHHSNGEGSTDQSLIPSNSNNFNDLFNVHQSYDGQDFSQGKPLE